MTDRLIPLQRSAHMARIRGTDTRPDIIVRRWLHAEGYRFRLHARTLPGRPDIVLPRHSTIILVHGCFWHRHPGCRLAYQPRSRRSFWDRKFSANVNRDRDQLRVLLSDGWKVIIVWECGLRGAHRTASALRELSDGLDSSGRTYLEIPSRSAGVVTPEFRSRQTQREGTEHGKRSTV
jgi:DNA mismatch endonuclease (patch repair protein)